MRGPRPSAAPKHCRRRHAFTLAGTADVSGVGLHSGRLVRVRLGPGFPGGGVTFVRTDLPGTRVRASPADVSGTELSTELGGGGGGGGVRTVEHLLAALCGAGVSSCTVALDAQELPILDGSSAPWLKLIRAAGLAPTTSAPEALAPRAPVWAAHGDAWVVAMPAAAPRLTYTIDFGAFAPIGRQSFSFYVHRPSPTGRSVGAAHTDGSRVGGGPAGALPARRSTAAIDRFEAELAPARTFATTQGVHAARAAGLALGGSLENALVCDERRWLNAEGLRFPDEPARHKTLDLLGDLALLGELPLAHVVAHKASHRLHVALARALAAGTEGAARAEHYV